MTALAFLLLVPVLDAVYLATSSQVQRHPVYIGVSMTLALALTAALVIGRRLWAWWLCMASAFLSLVALLSDARFHSLDDGIEVVFVALLLTPSMRRHVRGNRGGSRIIARPGLASLIVSGLLVLFGDLAARHHAYHTVGGRVYSGVFVWLVFAVVLRVVILAFQRARTFLHRHRASSARPLS
jgi:hypothetical protein